VKPCSSLVSLSPTSRRLISYSVAGILGGAALRQGVRGAFSSAHYLALAGTAALLLPTLKRNSSWFGPVITRFSTQERTVWLTIDDGPDPIDTPEILDVLARYDARATFFGIGEKIARWPHLAVAITNAGHQLQNHTMHHHAGSFWAATPERARREILLCSEVIEQTTGTAPTQFRVPVGLANPWVHAAAEKARMKLIGWSASGLDGISHSPERVVAKILHAVRPGSIILIHEGSIPRMRPGTRARTLEALLQRLSSQGYRMIIPVL